MNPQDINATIVAALATAGAAGGAVLLADPLLDGAAVGGAADLITTYSAATATVADTVIYSTAADAAASVAAAAPVATEAVTAAATSGAADAAAAAAGAAAVASTTLVDATAGSGAGEGIGAGAGALAGLGASVFGDSSTTGVGRRAHGSRLQGRETSTGRRHEGRQGPRRPVRRRAEERQGGGSKRRGAPCASKAPVEAVTKVAKAAGSPTSTKIAKGLATNADAATKAVKVAPSALRKTRQGLAASVSLKVSRPKRDSLPKPAVRPVPGRVDDKARAAKVAPVLDSTVAPRLLWVAAGVGWFGRGLHGRDRGRRGTWCRIWGVVLGIGALLGLAKWAGAP